MNIPLQQTKSWQKMLKDLGETTFFESGKNWQFLAILKSTKFDNYLYLPYGPYIKEKSAARSCYEAILSLSKEKNVSFIRIEPQDPKPADFLLNLPNCKKSHDLNPKDTWILDLTPEKSALISGFSQGTRTRFNQFQKKGLSVTTSKNPADIKHLVRLQQKLAHQKKIGTFSENYLKTELTQDFATLYLVHYTPKNPTPSDPPSDSPSGSPSDPPSDSSLSKISTPQSDQIIAASLFFDDSSTRYYMQSAADMDYKKLPATVAILSTALLDAKEKGLKNFDFWGIAPDGAPKNHPWAGFSEFKKSFGGHAVHYAGTHDLILKPVNYRLYTLARRANRLARKLHH